MSSLYRATVFSSNGTYFCSQIKDGLTSCDVDLIKDRYVQLDIIKGNASEVYDIIKGVCVCVCACTGKISDPESLLLYVVFDTPG